MGKVNVYPFINFFYIFKYNVFYLMAWNQYTDQHANLSNSQFLWGKGGTVVLLLHATEEWQKMILQKGMCGAGIEF